jgi:hypothetical protein
LLATEEDLQELPEAADVRMKAEEFQNYAQQMENAVLSLAISVEEVRSLVRHRKSTLLQLFGTPLNGVLAITSRSV